MSEWGACVHCLTTFKSYTIYLRPILVLLFNTSISIFNLFISINIRVEKILCERGACARLTRYCLIKVMDIQLLYIYIYIYIILSNKLKMVHQYKLVSKYFVPLIKPKRSLVLYSLPCAKHMRNNHNGQLFSLFAQ